MYKRIMFICLFIGLVMSGCIEPVSSVSNNIEPEKIYTGDLMVKMTHIRKSETMGDYKGISEYTYEFDEVGNVTKVTCTGPEGTITDYTSIWRVNAGLDHYDSEEEKPDACVVMKYDDNNRLIHYDSLECNYDQSDAMYSKDYFYDENGNRIRIETKSVAINEPDGYIFETMEFEYISIEDYISKH